jgi:ABC-type transport system substrate-binding protein
MSRVRNVVLLLLATVSVLASCADQADEAETTTSTAEAESPPPTSAAPSSNTTTTTVDEFIPDYAALIAAIESAMESTAYEGAALEDPEVFIATAELFCDLLREGMTTEELLAEYLDRLSDGGVVEVDEDDGLMAGVLLGASMEIVCPKYSEEST